MTDQAIQQLRRWSLPHTNNDRIALIVFILGGLHLLWYEIRLILPVYYEELTMKAYCHVIVAAMLAFNVYANMYMLATVDVTCSRRIFPSWMSIGWRYCEKCQQNVPPRSHHCKLCDTCVMKRDHHCWFAGYCVGYHNHRYYCMMVIYIVITAIYCNVFNYQFVTDVKGELGVLNVLSFFGPPAFYLFGYYDLYTMYVTQMSMIGAMLLVLFSWMLQIQLAQINSGQTQYEKKKGIKKYNMGLMRNIVEILGSRWYLVWLSPWIPSPLPGNGIEFQIMDKGQ